MMQYLILFVTDFCRKGNVNVKKRISEGKIYLLKKIIINLLEKGCFL